MRSRSHKRIHYWLIAGAAVLLVLLYTVYSYNKLKGRSFIHEPIHISITASMPRYAELELRYQTFNDPTKTQSAEALFHDSIPGNTAVFKIDSSYRLANFSIFFKLLRKNDEVELHQIKAANARGNAYDFSLRPKDLVATNNLELLPVNDSLIKLKKITDNDPSGAALSFVTRESLGGIFVRSGLRIPEIPSVPATLVIFILGLFMAHAIYPVISRAEWKGISPGTCILAAGILLLPSGERSSNLLLALALVAGIISGLQQKDLFKRLRKNMPVILPALIITALYLAALFFSAGHPVSMKLLKIKIGLPMTLMAVALNTNKEKELRFLFIALFTGVVCSIYIHLGWAIILMDTVEVKSRLFVHPQYYLESTIFSRVHHSYLSTIYLLSLISLHYLKDRFSLSGKEIWISSLLILMGLLFAFSRAAILALAIILIYHLLRKVFSRLRVDIGPYARTGIVFVLAGTLLLFVFVDLGIPSSSNQVRGLATRIDIWEVASDLVKQKPVAGWGPGPYKDALNQGTESSAFNSNIWNKLNTHNQFLETAGMFGLLTTLALICFLIFPEAFKKLTPAYRDLTLSTAFIFIVVFLFESALSRNLGILTFGLSYGLLIRITSADNTV
jgi:O-antigen ligase